MVQWLRLLTSTAEGMGSILVGELTSHMPRDTVRKKKKKKKKRKESTGNRADHMRDRISELEYTNLEMTQEREL